MATSEQLKPSIRENGEIEKIHVGFSRQHTLRVSEENDTQVMSDVSIITIGEALGHGLKIDGKTLDQAEELLKGKKLRAYLTHSGAWYSDRLTKEIGSFSGVYRDGDQLKAKQFRPFKAFRKNNQQQYDILFELAEEMPENFGVSIVPEGYAAWVMENGDEMQYRYGDDKPEGAVDDMPSLRLVSILSADFVDAPAANPGGLFRADMNNENNNKGNTMSESNDKELLALSKQVNDLKDEKADLKTQLKAKEDEITALSDNHKLELKAERERISEVLELGKAHKQDNLAFDAIKDGKSVMEFQKALLEAYKGGNRQESGEGSMELDANKEPKNRDEFLATYRSLRDEGKVAEATAYHNKNRAKIKA